MLVELYVKAQRVEEALTVAKRGITVCKELNDTAGQARNVEGQAFGARFGLTRKWQENGRPTPEFHRFWLVLAGF